MVVGREGARPAVCGLRSARVRGWTEEHAHQFVTQRMSRLSEEERGGERTSEVCIGRHGWWALSLRFTVTVDLGERMVIADLCRRVRSARAFSTRLDNIRLNKSMRCRVVLFDLQALRIEPGEKPLDSTPKMMAIGVAHASRLSQPDEELTSEGLDTMMAYELRDAARQRGVDWVGPRAVVADRLRQHMAKTQQPPNRVAASSAENDAPTSGRDKYEAKLQALRMRASMKAREGGGSGDPAVGARGGGGWCVQPGATTLSQYLDNRGILRGLLCRPSASAVAADAAEMDSMLDAERAQLLSQLAAPPFVRSVRDGTSAGLLRFCEDVETPPAHVMLLSSSIDLIGVARSSGMFTCYMRKQLGTPDTGMRGNDPDYIIASLDEAVHAFDELNGYSFRVVPQV